MITASKRITRATLKSFIKKNADQLYVWKKSKFDSMCDGVRNCDGTAFVKATVDVNNMTNGYLGVQNYLLWVTGGDSLSFYENDEFIGIDVYNCCGNSIVAIKK